jgi:hypothetical protein
MERKVAMSRTLPVSPSLEYLHNEAKAFLRRQRQGDATVCPVLRRLSRFGSAPDAEILAARVSLAEVQYALAMEYGFDSWAKLKRHVEAQAPRPQLRRGQGSAWIEGLPVLAWGHGKDCTFIGALKAALRVTDEPYTYADLMALSGVAFRVRTREDLCPSSAVAELPDEYNAIRQATGWNLPTEVQFGQEGWQPAVVQKIVASIDAGLPVLAYNDHMDIGVVYGYEQGGAVLWYIDYRSREVGTPYRVPAEKIGPLQSYIGRKDPALPAIEQLTHALQLAVLNWNRGVHDGGIPRRQYHYGTAAYDLWIEILEQSAALPPEKRNETMGERMHGHNIIFYWLIDARRAGATFLRERADLLDGAQRTAILRAADACNALANRMDQAQRQDKLFYYDRSHPYETRAAGAADDFAAIRRRETEVLLEVKQEDELIIRRLGTALSTMLGQDSTASSDKREE